ncbi:MAG: GspH/FimT family pseudopilin [Pseudomonadota bacterium]
MQTCRATSPDFRWRRPNQDHGFSMVELMVVIFVIGLAATFIVLSAPPSKPHLEKDTEAIVSLLNRAADEALVSGVAYGAVISDDGVRIVRADNGVWLPVPGAEARVSRDTALAEFETEAPSPVGTPPLWFDPAGMAQKGRIELSDRRSTVSILVSDNGGVSVLQESADVR